MPWGGETPPHSHFGLARTPQAGMMGSMEQEQYYIATEDGQAEGPYSFESLESSYTNGKITQKTLVSVVGGQEWMQFRTVLEQKWKEQSQLNKPAWRKIQEQQETQPSEFDSLKITVEGLFYFVGIIVFIAGIILLAYSIKEKQISIGFVYLLTGAFSCLGCFWCAKVSGLLSRAVDLLEAIAKRK